MCDLMDQILRNLLNVGFHLPKAVTLAVIPSESAGFSLLEVYLHFSIVTDYSLEKSFHSWGSKVNRQFYLAGQADTENRSADIGKSLSDLLDVF